MAVATSTNGPAASDDLLPALHEEIARLPEKYRLAVVHCDLEGMTQAQAAGQLHWSERTLHHRLAEGRARLKRRLARRGLAPDGATLGAVLLREARAAVPAAWSEATVRAAVATVNHTMTVGVVSAAAQQLAQEVFKIMLLRKLTWASATLLAAGLIGWGASAALVSLGQEAPKGATAPPAPPSGQRPIPPSRSRNRAPPTRPAHSRLAAGCSTPTASRWPAPGSTCATMPNVVGARSTRWPRGRRGVWRRRMRTAGSISSWTRVRAMARTGSGVTGWHKAQIAVAAPGFAPAWVEAGDMVKRGEMALRLVRDDVPVRGRVLDSQGRPVAGVVVRIRAIWEVNDGVDLDAMLASGAVDENMYRIARRYGDVARLGDPDLASGSRATLARGPERLDHRRRRSVRGPGDRARPHRPAGIPRRRRGGRHTRRDGPPREGAAQGPAAAQRAGRWRSRTAKPRSLASTRRGRSSSARPSTTSPARPSRSSASSA